VAKVNASEAAKTATPRPFPILSWDVAFMSSTFLPGDLNEGEAHDLIVIHRRPGTSGFHGRATPAIN
jgi:hypothetical protein